MSSEEKKVWQDLHRETEETAQLMEQIQRAVEQDHRTKGGEWRDSLPPPPKVPPEIKL